MVGGKDSSWALWLKPGPVLANGMFAALGQIDYSIHASTVHEGIYKNIKASCCSETSQKVRGTVLSKLCFNWGPTTTLVLAVSVFCRPSDGPNGL